MFCPAGKGISAAEEKTELNGNDWFERSKGKGSKIDAIS